MLAYKTQLTNTRPWVAIISSFGQIVKCKHQALKETVHVLSVALKLINTIING